MTFIFFNASDKILRFKKKLLLNKYLQLFTQISVPNKESYQSIF